MASADTPLLPTSVPAASTAHSQVRVICALILICRACLSLQPDQMVHAASSTCLLTSGVSFVPSVCRVASPLCPYRKLTMPQPLKAMARRRSALIKLPACSCGQCCIVLLCTGLYCTMLCCAVLYCMVFHQSWIWYCLSAGMCREKCGCTAVSVRLHKQLFCTSDTAYPVFA